MHAHGAGAILEGIVLLVSLIGEFALLANRDEAGAEPDSWGGSKDKAPGGDAYDRIDTARLVLVDHQIDAGGKEMRVRQQGGDVFELDPRFGEIRNVADGALDFQARRLRFDHRCW